MSKNGWILLVVGVAVAVVLTNATYIVPETQQVIITRFGEPVGEAVTEPGLHFLTPFVQKANFFEKRFLGASLIAQALKIPFLVCQYQCQEDFHWTICCCNGSLVETTSLLGERFID